jgi:hypothetical protein
MDKQRLINKIKEYTAARDALDEPMRNLRHAISRAENGVDRYINPVGLRAELLEKDRLWHDLNEDRSNAVFELLKVESAEHEKQTNPAKQVTTLQARAIASLINFWSENISEHPMAFQVHGAAVFGAIRVFIYQGDDLTDVYSIDIAGDATLRRKDR